MGFRLAPREVAPLPPQPVGPPFSSILGPVLPLWAEYCTGSRLVEC